MPLPKPGDYITAKCSRCDDVTGHVVMLVLDGAIAKVECKACGSVHKYRDTAQKKTTVRRDPAVKHVRAGQTREEGRTVASSTRVVEEKRTAPRSAGVPRTKAAKSAVAWQEAMNRHAGESAIAYSMNTPFALKDYLSHPVFGLGEVIAVTKPDKITVLFEEGPKVLRCTLSAASK